MFDCVSFIIGTLFIALAENFQFILIGRFIHGYAYASGMVTVPIYTSEITQPQVRKTNGCIQTACYTSGFALALVFGKINKIKEHLSP